MAEPHDTASEMVFFEQDGASTFIPQGYSRSPWTPKALNGMAVAGLLTHVAEQVESAQPMLPAHIVIDILRPVAFAPFEVSCAITRDGRKMQMVEAQIAENGEPVARARILRVREQESPSLPAPLAYPRPDELPDVAFLDDSTVFGRAMRSRVIRETGDPRVGAAWFRFPAGLTPEVPINGLVQAAMLADMGHGLAPPADYTRYTFANVDISLHLTRRPVGEWMLVASRSEIHGLGVGFSDMLLADEAGAFGRAHQTMFVDPRPASPGAVSRGKAQAVS